MRQIFSFYHLCTKKSLRWVGLFSLFFTHALAAQPLPVDQAFPLRVGIDEQTIQLSWQVAPGFHLYRNRFSFSTPSLQLGKADIPQGTQANNALGNYRLLTGKTVITLPYRNNSAQEVYLHVGYQGCSDAGFCYPPVSKSVLLQLSAVGQQVVEITDNDYTPPSVSNDTVSNLLQKHSWLYALGAFFILGLLLAFTPCVLPMLPIIGSLIAGQQHINSRRGLCLSIAYVLGMALTYSIAGVITGLAGSSVQAALQLPWVIASFSLLFVVLALSMFGVYQLQLPARLQNALSRVGQQHTGGSYVGVFVMGILATLVVSPCVSAPLVGALAYIGQTGNASFGGVALFMLGLGMGTPLIILSTVGSRLLPKAGAWMNTVKHVFGFLLLLVALDLLSRILPAVWVLAGYGLLSFGVAGYCWCHRWWGKLLAVLFALYGVLAMVGVSLQHTNPLNPLASPQQQQGLVFQPVQSYADLQQLLAQHRGSYVLVDFYAHWCVACKLMEQTVFTDVRVKQALKNVVLLQADVTENTATDKVLQKALGVYAPPTLVLFNPQGKIIARFVGEMDAQSLIGKLHGIGV